MALRQLIVVLIALIAAVTSTAAAQVPTQDSVTGSFITGNSRGDLLLTFDVHSGPSGENPTGTVAIRTFAAGDFGTFAVSCLGASGNRATVVAPFPQAAPPAPAGIVIHVEDNGVSGDRVNWSFVSVVPTACPPPTFVVENEPSSGDVKVVDAQPLPISKDQCKNSGWRSYGVFKNQGDCVSFVATAGKHPPANSP